jgi:hypothetical protein
MPALAPTDQIMPPGLTTVPVDDRAENELLLVWRANDPSRR